MAVSAEMDNRMLLLVLTLIPGIGPARIKALKNHLPNLTDILHSGVDELMIVPGIGESLARQIHHFLHHAPTRQAAEKAAEEQIAELHRYNAQIITILDPEYPPLLQEIYDPPSCLFVRGALPDVHAPGLAVVGTRYASQYGKQATAMLCREIVNCGIVVFSGLAYGIDMAAHTAVLEHGGTTVAVLASGVETIYTDPKGKIWPKIIEQGAIISEEWFGSALSPGKFPKRNRIISGICSGTIVIESDLKGGSLITAASALEQNREVFAVPGSIFSRTSKGTNKLIQQGQAKAVMNVEDIISELGAPFLQCRSGLPVLQNKSQQNRLTPQERAVLHYMGSEPIQIDALATASMMDVSTLLVHLFELEMKEAVTQHPGQFFLKRII
ncbi:MAG: DNA-protecting protein DprA [Chlorobium sp.]|nr:MAG: DNA-protecting protein DprA [Chlorobium sp.]